MGKWPFDWPLCAGVPREVAVATIRGTEQVLPRAEFARIFALSMTNHADLASPLRS
jgi:hypothetical protein